MKYTALLMVKGYPAHTIDLEIAESKLKGHSEEYKELEKKRLALLSMMDVVDVVVTEIKG